MTTNTQASVATSARKDWKQSAERTQVYIRALMRKNGATATELKQAVIEAGIVRARAGKNSASLEQFTSHNTYSLTLLSRTYGFEFMTLVWSDEAGKAERRFYFRSPKNDALFAEHAADWSVAKATFNLGKKEALEAAKAAKKAAKQAAKAPVMPENAPTISA